MRIYNSVKQVRRVHPSIRPSIARNRNMNREHRPKKTEVIPTDVIPTGYGKQHIAQYAPDAPNDINSIDGYRNGFRNNYTPAMFNVNIHPQSRARDNGHPRISTRPHQHRHQPGMHADPERKTPKHVSHRFGELPTQPTTTTTTTTSTTTTTAPPPPTPTTTRPATTTTARTPIVYDAIPIQPKRSHTMTAEEKKIQRESLRERLNRLTPEEQQIFFQERAKRKRLKEQMLRKLQEAQRNEDNEVVQ